MYVGGKKKKKENAKSLPNDWEIGRTTNSGPWAGDVKRGRGEAEKRRTALRRTYRDKNQRGEPSFKSKMNNWGTSALVGKWGTLHVDRTRPQPKA